MTTSKADLEKEIEVLKLTIAEQSQTIVEFGVLADRAVELENTVFDQQQTIARLNDKLDKVRTPDVWDALAEGWLNSAIGKRALLTNGVDLTGFQMGVDRENFNLIKSSYANILEALKAANVAATRQEQQEIGILLKRLGFA